jgi:hypothetical protein
LIIVIFNAFVNTPLMTMFHKKTPTKYRSRVFSVISVLAQLVTPLGAVLYGIGLDLMATHWLLLIANIGSVIIIVHSLPEDWIRSSRNRNPMKLKRRMVLVHTS